MRIPRSLTTLLATVMALCPLARLTAAVELYVVKSQNVQLFRAKKVVGFLSFGDMVRAKPHPEDVTWLLVDYGPTPCEAGAAHFQLAGELLDRLKHQVSEHEREVRDADSRLEEVNRRMLHYLVLYCQAARDTLRSWRAAIR